MPESSVHPKVRDTRVLRRNALAVLLPIGPLCVAVLRLVLPYGTNDDPQALLAAVAADQAAQSTVLWLSTAAVLALVPALFALTRLAMCRAPALALAAIILALPGYLGIAALTVSDAAALAAVTAGLSPADSVALLGELAAQPALTASVILFVVGHVWAPCCSAQHCGGRARSQVGPAPRWWSPSRCIWPSWSPAGPRSLTVPPGR